MALLLVGPLSSLWESVAGSVDAAERLLPGSTLGVCFVAVFLTVFAALRVGAAAGERRGAHDIARARLGLSDEHPLPLHGAVRDAGARERAPRR